MAKVRLGFILDPTSARTQIYDCMVATYFILFGASDFEVHFSEPSETSRHIICNDGWTPYIRSQLGAKIRQLVYNLGSHWSQLPGKRASLIKHTNDEIMMARGRQRNFNPTLTFPRLWTLGVLYTCRNKTKQLGGVLYTCRDKARSGSLVTLVHL